MIKFIFYAGLFSLMIHFTIIALAILAVLLLTAGVLKCINFVSEVIPKKGKPQWVW